MHAFPISATATTCGISHLFVVLRIGFIQINKISFK